MHVSSFLIFSLALCSNLFDLAHVDAPRDDKSRGENIDGMLPNETRSSFSCLVQQHY